MRSNIFGHDKQQIYKIQKQGVQIQQRRKQYNFPKLQQQTNNRLIQCIHLICKFNNTSIQQMYKYDWDCPLKDMLGDIQKCDDIDVLSKLAFSKDDKFLAVGDHCGRLIIFQQDQSSWDHITQLKVYNTSFDWIQDRDISAQINFIQWLTPYDESHKIVTANESCIKIWRIKQTYQRNYQAQTSPIMPYIKDQQIRQKSCRWKNMYDFPNLHKNPIKNVSISENQQFILSADKYSIYKWNIENPNVAIQLFQKQKIFRMEKSTFDQLDYITSIHFHPFTDNIFCYTTKEGQIIQNDTRLSCKSNSVVKIHNNIYSTLKSDFTQFLSLISDFDYHNENQLICRDYMNCHLWDLRKAVTPINVINIYPPTIHFLSELIESQSIKDQFKIYLNKTNGKIITPHYQNCFHQIDLKKDTNVRISVDFNNAFTKEIIPKSMRNTRNSSIQTNQKIRGLTYGYNGNKIVASSQNCIFFFNKPNNKQTMKE